MDKKKQVIEICKEICLPSIRKMVAEETEFTNPKEAFDLLR